MRILHVLHTSLPSLCGYSMRSDSILRAQRAMGITAGVVTSAQQPGAAADEVIDGIPYLRTPMPGRRRGVPQELTVMMAQLARIDDAVDDFRPDLIHAHSPVLVGMPAWLVARERHLPFVYEIRDLWENASVDRGKFRDGSLLYRAARAAEQLVLRNADAVVTIGELLRSELASRVGAGATLDVVPNGVELGDAATASDAEALGKRWGLEGKRIVGYLGTFQPYEGLEVLIAAVPEILRRVPDAHVVIVGKGSMDVELRRLIQSRGLGAHVSMPGPVPHAETGAFYMLADVLVYPRNRTKTTALTPPLKPLEAMAMSRSVLVSDAEGLLELVRPNDTGMVFHAGDPLELAVHCACMIDSPALRATMGRAAREWVVQHRQWKDLVARYIPIYESAIRRKSALGWQRASQGLVRARARADAQTVDLGAALVPNMR